MGCDSEGQIVREGDNGVVSQRVRWCEKEIKGCESEEYESKTVHEGVLLREGKVLGRGSESG
jgi:hypothetical protein